MPPRRDSAVEPQLLRRLPDTPFADRLDLVAVTGWSRGAIRPRLAELQNRGLVASLGHASPLIAPTRRYCLTESGVRRHALAEG